MKNKIDGYVYKLSDNEGSSEYLTQTNGGYIVSFSDDGSKSQSVTVKGEFMDVFTYPIYVSAPGMTDTVSLFFKKDGTMGVVRLNKDLKLEYKDLSYKNIVKYYLISLSSNAEYSSGGQTVVIQTEDGTLYDIFNDIDKFVG